MLLLIWRCIHDINLVCSYEYNLKIPLYRVCGNIIDYTWFACSLSWHFLSVCCPPYELVGMPRLNVLKRESIDPCSVCVDTHLSLEGPSVCLCIFIICLFIGLHEQQEEQGIESGQTEGTKFTNLRLNHTQAHISILSPSAHMPCFVFWSANI